MGISDIEAENVIPSNSLKLSKVTDEPELYSTNHE